MSDFFSKALDLLPVVSDSPLALVGLIVLIAAATLLFWKQSQLRTLARTIEALPESDRLERIRLDYGVRPRRGISAQAWLHSRRQDFLYRGYVSSLFTALLIVIVLVGKLVQKPGGVHAAELRQNYAVLTSKLAGYELAARDMRNAFVLAGENAIGPDNATAAILTDRIQRYNDIYEDLRKNQQLYLEPVVRWLDDRPDLANETNGVVQFALQDLHQACLIQFNSAAYQRTMKLRTLPPDATPSDIALIRSQGALEIQNLGAKADTLLDVLSQRLRTLTHQIRG